jgi:glutamate synthase (ferredoxin)
LVTDALQILVNLDHRGACGCEANTGDGAGISCRCRTNFSPARRPGSVSSFPPPANTAWACCSCRKIRPNARRSRPNFAKIISGEGQTVLGWRDVPTDNSSLGKTAVAAEPFMAQVFVGRNPALQGRPAFERKLYVIRKVAEQRIRYGGKKFRRQMVLRFQPVGRTSFTRAC